METNSLTAEEKRIIEDKGTEAPFSGEYDDFYPPEGVFVCKRCSNPLFDAKAKFNAKCGWPAFDKCYEGSLDISKDRHPIFGAEITCARCGGHLGHEYEGEGFTDTSVRHCVNSLSIKFVPKDE